MAWGSVGLYDAQQRPLPGRRTSADTAGARGARSSLGTSLGEPVACSVVQRDL